MYQVNYNVEIGLRNFGILGRNFAERNEWSSVEFLGVCCGANVEFSIREM